MDARPPRGPLGETFPKACRILRRGEFLRIQGHAPRVHGKRLILQFGHPPHGSSAAIIESRLGLTVSKKVGPSVLRNQVKRWLREAFRRAPTDLRPRRELRSGAPDSLPYDLVVTVKRGVDDFSYAVLRDELLHGIARYLQNRSQRPARGAGGKPRALPPKDGSKDGGARRGDGVGKGQ